jgi:hypothetical protein
MPHFLECKSEFRPIITNRWQLIVARVIAVYMAICQIGSLLPLALLFILEPPPASLIPLVIIVIAAAGVAFWTVVKVFLDPLRACFGFLVLLVLYVAGLAAHPDALRVLSDPAARYVVPIVAVIFGVGVYGVPYSSLCGGAV